jgi:hypothetical protein
MIVRILSEGQYRVEGSTLEEIHRLDEELMTAMTHDDADRFHELLHQVAGLVRSGQELPPDHLVESDLILPADDTTLEEAKQLFRDPS